MNMRLDMDRENAGEPPAKNARARILLVEDDVYIRELNAGVLIRSGYLVDSAADGAGAWRALNAGSYDLLITDNEMPTVTGLELIKKMQSEDMTLPVILASGTVPFEELQLHPWLKLDAFLTKPFTSSDLLDTVKKVLKTAEDVRIRVESDFPLILRAVSETELRTQTQSPSSFVLPSNAPTRGQRNPPSRILVVDDESDSRQLTVDVLATSGYEVKAVKDGAAGWEALQKNDYNLIITDNKMPRMTGMEMIQKLRAATMTLPVIMATGCMPTHEFVRKPWLKPDIMLEKPYSNDDLLTAVRQLLEPDDGQDDQRESLIPKYL